jgi:cell division protein FtsI/penicillin-binding protein 2
VKSTLSLKKWTRRACISLCLVIVTACGSISLNNNGSGGGAPIIQIAQTPEDTVRAFLDAWNRLDYTSMYTQLSSQSQGLNAFSVFQATYQNADKTLGTKGVTYTLHDTKMQGDTAAISYDAAIQSTIFGAINDNGRIMRVVRAPDNSWKVAWSTMDIINGFANGTTLRVDAKRPPRGNIYDHNGQLMVEQDSEVVELYVKRSLIPDEARCIDLLSVLLRAKRTDLTKLLDSYNPDTTVPLGDVDPDIYSARQGDLDNTCKILTNTRTTRRYVGHGIDTHVIGYVGQISSDQLKTYLANGYQQGDLVGLAGIEEQYETQLAGKSQQVLRVIEPGGMTVRELAGTSGQPSQSVKLTLDLNLQWATAQALSDAYNAASGNWAAPEHSPGAGAVVIDIHTGAILALASYPSFDPGIFNPDTPIFQAGQYIGGLENAPNEPFKNKAVQEQYSPGSTFKIVTLSATAQEGIFKPNQMFDCVMEWHGQQYGDSQPVRFDWRQFETGDQHFPTGQITMSEALTASCNPFFYQMGALLFKRDPSTLENYARQMGLGKSTGLDITVAPEANGSLPILTSADQAISGAIGQLDTQVTALQMARMVAGIANGGTLYKPYVVQQVGGDNGATPSYVAQPTVAGDMGLSQSTLDIVRAGMCASTTREATNRTAVDKQGKPEPLGTSWFVFDDPTTTGVAPYRVCSKTGTAQTARPEPNGWYVSFAPKDDPQIAIAVVVPFGREGSETAAPIVRRIYDAYFNAPQAPWPDWWVNLPYIPLNIPEGATGG